jgi:trehalose synthase
VREVEVQALDPARLEPLIGSERLMRFEAVAERTQAALAGRAVLNVNSTAVGGGVAEMLQTLLAYARGAGVDARWLVMDGDPEFFAITKRIHNGLYGGPGDGGALGAAERRHYDAVTRANAEQILAVVRPGDVVVLHDPQPAGLAATILAAGARLVWRCHVGADQPNAWTERAWEFIRPDVERAEALVVSRAAFAPPWARPADVHVIPPSLDPFSAKNEPMSRRNVRLALAHAGVLQGDGGAPAVPFTRRDGSPGRFDRPVDVLRSGPPPPPDAPTVVQLSRWDVMKDFPGVMEGFVRHVDHALGAHLILAGPSVSGVADDPEAAAVFRGCVAGWERLPLALRSRVHLVNVPMDDPDEAAALANALQRHASVIVQKSLAEGFGLTVTEGMWKGRPVVATRVGGIADQIVDGVSGLLLDDPHDLAGLGAAVERLLRDPEGADRLGHEARRRVTDEFLGDRHLERYADLFAALI